MNKLYLVRHGENPANLTKEFSCRKVDYSLTPKGRLQAGQTADYFCLLSIDAIYSSPLKRAVETATIIAGPMGLAVNVLENLREIDVGDLEGMPPTQETWSLHNRILMRWMSGDTQVSFPGGEDLPSAQERMRQGVELALLGRQEQSIIMVGHGGLFTITLAHLCPQVDLFSLLGKENHNCSITEIDVSLVGGKLVGSLIRWADFSHLHGQAADLVSGFME